MDPLRSWFISQREFTHPPGRISPHSPPLPLAPLSASSARQDPVRAIDFKSSRIEIIFRWMCPLTILFEIVPSALIGTV